MTISFQIQYQTDAKHILSMQNPQDIHSKSRIFRLIS